VVARRRERGCEQTTARTGSAGATTTGAALGFAAHHADPLLPAGSLAAAGTATTGAAAVAEPPAAAPGFALRTVRRVPVAPRSIVT
jgi:hypothetical protein